MSNRKRHQANKQKIRLAALAAMPDSEIDTSDIPEDTDWSKGQRGKFLIQGKARFKVQKEEQISLRDPSPSLSTQQAELT